MEDLLELLKLGCSIKLLEFGLELVFVNRGGIEGKVTTIFVTNSSLESFDDIEYLIDYVKNQLNDLDNTKKYFNQIPEIDSE